MPRRTDLQSILIIGSGPIIIGQAVEFDYSGTQACKALREEGYRIILVNSNPATIMTDPEFADRTYIEPLTPATLEKIIERERPDAILPTVGGQTAINLAMALHESGALEKYGVELIGASYEAMQTAEDRQLFKEAMGKIGVDVAISGYAASLDEALEIGMTLGYPIIVRPSFTLGGSGGGIAYNIEEFREIVTRGLQLSPVHKVLIEESLIGWKEFELEVMRDKADNVIIVCSIENFDPMGVHTGDSITVAPQQTLSNTEYQAMRDDAKKIIRAIGVETGGSNIQFCVHPVTGRRLAIEMNPRVSRSSALASKATGFPIAKFAAKLAAGYTLDEIPNDITKKTPASFEPVLDYVVVKIPRFAFEKFRNTSHTLGLSMQSVGETMAMGRTFNEAMQKALRSLEIGVSGFEPVRMGSGFSVLGSGKGTSDPEPDSARDRSAALPEPRTQNPEPSSRTQNSELSKEDRQKLLDSVRTPTPERLLQIGSALRAGFSVDEIYKASFVDPWFLHNLAAIVKMEDEIRESAELVKDSVGAARRPPDTPGAADESVGRPAGRPYDETSSLLRWKREGFSDRQIADLTGTDEASIRALRYRLGVRPVYKRVDTCAAEFTASTPYLYSTYETECEAEPTDRKKVMILGSGPNRIGQGIEFDTCCVHASFALQEIGFETIMVNCNPETVSTDYDTSDRLYFEPLTLEDVLEIIEIEKPAGVIVQFGGQTPLKLAKALGEAGAPMWGTSTDSIDLAEDRERFGELLDRLDILSPEHGIAKTAEEAYAVADRIGYPVVVRPSYVLGGRAMATVFDHDALRQYMMYAVEAAPGQPILVDRFLENAFEIDVDAVSDGTDVVIAGVMQHIEEAGIHSGDSTTVIPPYMISQRDQDRIRRRTVELAKALNVIGLMNVQYAIAGGELYVLEVNPRASRTVPYVSKATGVPFAKIAAQVMAGKTLAELGLRQEPRPPMYYVKAPVFPFNRFPAEDTVLGPEMKSTGEVMGSAETFGEAYSKALLAAGVAFPSSGTAFISVNNYDKRPVTVQLAKELTDLGFALVATKGTRDFLEANGVAASLVFKVHEGRPNIVDLMINNEIALVINTPMGKSAFFDDTYIRRTALQRNLPCITTLFAVAACVEGIREGRLGASETKSLQEQHGLT